MKRLAIAFILSAFTAGMLSSVVVSTQAQAYHGTKCKKGYEYDDDMKKCVREDRGSHG